MLALVLSFGYCSGLINDGMVLFDRVLFWGFCGRTTFRTAVYGPVMNLPCVSSVLQRTAVVRDDGSHN